MRRLFVTGGTGFIGTNLVEAWKDRYDAILDFSTTPPLVPDHEQFWRRGELLDAEDVLAAVEQFQPTEVIHLAARTDCDESISVEQGYSANTRGTQNLLEAVNATPSVERLVIVSSQFVCRAGFTPQSESDFDPDTVYGRSKVIAEQMTRETDPGCVWTIVRPTNIWGPWHPRYPVEFWRICQRGLYFHPSVPSPVRSYGYVGNVVWQLEGILRQPAEAVHRRVFYLGDEPAPIDIWVEAFHRALSGRERMRRVPYPLLKLLAWVGDGIGAVSGRAFYLNSSRLRSMTTDYPTPMHETLELLGAPPYTLQEGVAKTVAWLDKRKAAER
jgi:nucleoside-diphosphate-sugar epimerase